MRVLHIEVGGTYGGSARALELYLRNCSGAVATHDVLFYYPTPRSEAFAEIADRVTTLSQGRPEWATSPSENGPTLFGRLSGAVAMVRRIPSTARLFRLVREGSYDVVHVNNTFTYHPESVLTAVWAGKPVVAHMRNPVSVTLLHRWLGRRLSYLLSENERFMTELSSLRLRCPVVQWYAGIQVPVPDRKEVRSIRRELGGPGDLLIASAGRLEEQKGYEYLIRAARIVVRRFPQARFVIAGSGPKEAGLEREIRQTGLEHHFRLLGFRSDTAAVMAACRLFVSSSLWEGLPLAVLEAMTLGRPVIATDAGGTREVVKTGETGILVPPRDPEGLADAILRLLSAPRFRRAIAKRGRELARGYENVGARAAALDKILEDVAADFYIQWLLSLRWQRLPAFKKTGPHSVRPLRRHPRLLQAPGALRRGRGDQRQPLCPDPAVAAIRTTSTSSSRRRRARLRPASREPHEYWVSYEFWNRPPFSTYEGMPLTVSEALAMGKPVVATRVDGTLEVVEDSQTGLLVPPGDATAIAGAVLALLRDPARGRPMGESGRRRVREQFDLARQVSMTARVYRDLLEGSGAQR